MARAFFFVALVAVLALSLSGETSALSISGKVFWDEAASSDGAADVRVFCVTPAPEYDTLDTVTNCCGEYSFDGLEGDAAHTLWAHHIHLVKEPCPVSGPECWKEVATETKPAAPGQTDVNFDLELDCGNDQEPCD